MKRLLFISFIIITLCGCVNKEQIMEAVYPDFAELTLYRFPNNVCSDTVYTKCYEISKEQCIIELNQINSQCIENTKLKMGIFSKENKFLKHYSSCILREHLFIRKREGLSTCGKEIAPKIEGS